MLAAPPKRRRVQTVALRLSPLIALAAFVIALRHTITGTRQCRCSAAAAGGGKAPPKLPPGDGPGGHDLKQARAAAAAAAAPDRPGKKPAGAAHGIPHILHRIYVADPQDKQRANFTYPIGHEAWLQSCAYMHSRRSGWQMMVWDWDNVHALICNHYPWFMPFFRDNATKMVEKSDLARYAVLHRVGGLYLDSDMECWRESSDMLEGFDLVAQSTNEHEGTTNAVIAARPGLKVFHRALQLVQTRVGKNNETLDVIERTANGLFAAALQSVGVVRGPKGLFQTDSFIDGAVYHLYRSGTWFHPCQWWEVECRRHFYTQRIAGIADMRKLVGWHRMVGSWMGGKQDGIGIVNATAEFCRDATHVRGNGKVGGWVAPNRGKRRRQLQAEGGGQQPAG
ncbi:hypothetical protein D9Q98_005354 [Chlorella vulgaris]|uniref:Uncharacterized protein n=1 Tax=Chlorella vulgaris TaxID=3077 RepID=A0A9D4TM30_CHLVU|nr:hypothetical protein D9Q98_005354 [Chlorella vulgaris]